VVLHVLVVDLQHVVVDVHHGERHPDPEITDLVRAEHLELHRAHRPGGVLDQDLVDRDRDVAAGHQLAPDEVSP
jgi:hypothetical protein